MTKDIDKQLILKNVTPIRPIPNEFILKAMDEYAKQKAIEFAEYVAGEDLQLYKEGWCQPGGSNGFHYTTEQLFDIFNTNKEV